MPRKLRIFHVYKDYFPPVVGGIEKTINLMCEGLRDEYDVRVLAANSHFLTEDEAVRDIPIVKAGSWGRIASTPISTQFVHVMKCWRSDIWHFHCPHPTGDVSYLVARPPGKVVVTYHSDVVRQRWAMGLYGPLLRKFLRRADVIMPTSPNYIESSPWLRPERAKCRVVPLGIPLERFALTDRVRERAAAIRREAGAGGPIVLFVGKFRYYKGLQYLIPAMKKVPARLALVGEGPLRPALERQAARCGVADRVVFAGEVSDADLPAWFHAADVFCMPSHLRSEAFGISQIEAMACGLPVVSCAIDSGVPFVNRDGETGLSVEPESPRALALALRRLLRDDALRRRMGDAARRRARERFSVEAMLDSLRQVYDDVVTNETAK